MISVYDGWTVHLFVERTKNDDFCLKSLMCYAQRGTVQPGLLLG